VNEEALAHWGAVEPNKTKKKKKKKKKKMEEACKKGMITAE
jgi:hypothetical protein